MNLVNKNLIFLKNINLFLVVGVLFFSCNESELKVNDPIDSITNLPIPLDTLKENIFINDTVQFDTKPLNTIIEGKVIFHYPYCGGAAPTEEILAEVDQVYPLTFSTLKLKNNSGEYTITTDGNGNFSTNIPLGYYDVFLTKGINKNLYDVSPNACENCLTHPITNIKIKADKKIVIEFTFNCDPGAKTRP